ncbi:MAG: phosphate ABC transporter permease subunit PstC [Candidatus Pelagadaptatus aseana]|uniref:phosphate ABC transporter permease subunit PstC n=1 Tax=Candidatus Pelagadaptatus aseana TaxID=3120508 RepID=UPI0039B26CD3
MDTSTLFMTLLIVIAVAYVSGRKRAMSLADKSKGGFSNLNSLPFYHGALAALWCGIPSLLLLLGWKLFENSIIENLIISGFPDAVKSLPESELGLMMNTVRNIAEGANIGVDPAPYLLEAAARLQDVEATSQFGVTAITISLCVAFACAAIWHIYPEKKARNQVETTFKNLLLVSASLAIFTTVAIVFSVLFESLRFFEKVPFFDFVFGLEWSPQMALRADQVGGSGAFGAVPLFAGTLLISFIALLVAVPSGLMAAIYLSEYASTKVRQIVKPLLEILAGIPTVVYGFFAALTVAPFIRDSGGWVVDFMGLQMVVSSESALAAGLVMGIMIIPFVSSLSDDVIAAVPQAMRDGSLGLGATKSETVKNVIIPAALPGIVSGVLLAASRAIGETMIVVMAAGLAANLTANPLESVTTVTVQIVTLLVGDQEFDSPKTLSAFALGLMLFVVTLLLNVIALHVVKKYREQYE